MLVFGGDGASCDGGRTEIRAILFRQTIRRWVVTENNGNDARARFAIFRAKDGRSYEDARVMYLAEPVSSVAAEGLPKLQAAGYDHGHKVTLLFATPGFSLTHVWFKSGFPLPRHSHNTDCLYYVVAGSLKIGTEELEPGDGFFIGADVPYTYIPGDKGVEVLEFRGSNQFDIRFLAENPAFWAHASDQVRGRLDAWSSEVPPTTPLRMG